MVKRLYTEDELIREQQLELFQERLERLIKIYMINKKELKFILEQYL